MHDNKDQLNSIVERSQQPIFDRNNNGDIA